MSEDGKLTIVIDPGFLPALEIKSVLEHYAPACETRVVYAKSKIRTRWRGSHLPDKSVSYDAIETHFQGFDGVVVNNYIEGFKSFLNDHRNLLICERCLHPRYGNSVFHQIRRLEKLFFGSLNYLNDVKPDYVLFFATPHNPKVMALEAAANHLNIPVLIVEYTPILWRYWVISGVDKYTHIPLLSCCEGGNDPELVEKEVTRFIKEKNQKYEVAIPQYEKIHLDKKKGKFWSWGKEVLHHKFRIPSLIRKRRLFNSYCRHVQPYCSSDPNIVFFLHFQPEKTTMPEGLDFGQQWIAIRTLSLSLPEGYNLLVKEHPSTFTNYTDLMYRHASFYEDIASLPNVCIVPLESDTFELIDSSCAIATITGHVGVEALSRGTQVIVFGNASYRNAPGVFCVSNEKDVANAITNILQSDDKAMIINKMEQYLAWVVENSTSGLQHGNVDFEGDLFGEIRPSGHLRLFRNILERLIEGNSMASVDR
ncbi:hypothetical protein [Desulfoluna butyratoxydans]|uniref:Capsule polysaccharide biosynthesis n=1 Tax=Desulfoluna butyratoxydans TaxID=231438 RepID=A0A4U8YST7_9BACT|nr:hypothetical protein [Desulfoluna butyratoxydans]VFQ47456.1 capsule polysaccharide biosynthesis [Desulfoluna butyratoxydans]